MLADPMETRTDDARFPLRKFGRRTISGNSDIDQFPLRKLGRRTISLWIGRDQEPRGLNSNKHSCSTTDLLSGNLADSGDLADQTLLATEIIVHTQLGASSSSGIPTRKCLCFPCLRGRLQHQTPKDPDVNLKPGQPLWTLLHVLLEPLPRVEPSAPRRRPAPSWPSARA